MEIDYTDISSCRLAWNAIKNEIGYISGVKAYFDTTDDYSGFMVVVSDDPYGEIQQKLREAFKKVGLLPGSVMICEGVDDFSVSSGAIIEIGRSEMKDYVSLTIGKLNQLIEQHPDADIKYKSKSLKPSCSCKVLHNDINYDEVDNTIYLYR